MMKTHTLRVTALAAATVFCASFQPSVSYAEKPTPGFNHTIPEQIMTPNTVNTRIGDLHFYDGMPDKVTLAKVFDNLDFIRGIDVFLNFIPASSIEAMRVGFMSIGADRSNKVLMFDDLILQITRRTKLCLNLFFLAF